MMNWLSANLGTILIGLLLLAVVITILAVMHKNKKKGKTACGCDCAHCPMSGSCHNK